ncbi:MAG: hypothetical protein HY665_07265 [Chloroflexi bacterium]|nr:hypothetical protein [Chloroflexota bacterium]
MAAALIITIGILTTLAFIAWLIYRAIKVRQVKAHHVSYGISIITGIFTFAFFLSMNLPPLVKILVSIVVGIALIIAAANIQRRRQASKT